MAIKKPRTDLAALKERLAKKSKGNGAMQLREARSGLAYCIQCGSKKACRGPIDIVISSDIEDMMRVGGARCSECGATQAQGVVITHRATGVSPRTSPRARAGAVEALLREAESADEQAAHHRSEASRARRIATDLQRETMRNTNDTLPRSITY